MGNRAVITTKKNFENDGVGVYVHWNGGRDSIQAFLTYCKMKGFRAPDEDCYGFARLTQVIANYFVGGLSVGIDKVSRLDCDNLDNGTYIIKGWEIVDRKYIYEGFEEQEAYDLEGTLISIDDFQPESEQMGAKKIKEKLNEMRSEKMISKEIINKIYDKLANNDGGFEPSDATDMWVDNDKETVYITVADAQENKDRHFRLQLVEMEADQNDKLRDKAIYGKLYEAEYDAHQFMKGWHTLKEWASFGFNKVVYDTKEYWDGQLNGYEDIYEDVENLEYDYYDFDEDGYMTVYLRKGEK